MSKALLIDKRFWPMFWTQFFGAFNDNVFKNALVILIAFKAYSLLGLGADQMVALCGGIFILPFFLFSATAGQIADKYPKHKLIFWIKVWEIIVMLIGGSGFIFENLPLLIASLFLMGLQSTFFGPVKYSILPELVDDDELVQGNSLFSMGTFVSILLGTMLGGYLIAIKDSGGSYVALSVILFAIIGTVFAGRVQKLVPNDPSIKVDIKIFKPTYDILKISKKREGVWNSILGISWFWFFGAALLSIFPIYVTTIIKAPESLVTTFLALFSVGVAIGSILCERFSRERLELGLVPFGSLGMTLFAIDLFLVGDFKGFNGFDSLLAFFDHSIAYRVTFDILMLSVFAGFFIVPLYTFIQQRSEPSSRSRIIAGNNILNALFMVISSILLTVLYGYEFTVPQLFLIFGLLNLAVTTYIYTVIPEFLLRFICMLVSRSIYRLKVSGHQHIPEESACVLVCNHVSFVDWFLIASGVKRPVRFVMHYSFMKIPLIKFLFKGAKVIPIAGKKEDETVLNQAMEDISQALKDGDIICIFPEGLITHDGKVNTYKPGIERIIKRDAVPVIPMTLQGLWGSFFSRKYGKAMSNPLIIPKTIWTKVDLKIYDPWQPEDVSANALEHFTKEQLGEVISPN
jgi:1-acyl-sn-glycerol-3-phosphate acyltransferase